MICCLKLCYMYVLRTTQKANYLQHFCKFLEVYMSCITTMEFCWHNHTTALCNVYEFTRLAQNSFISRTSLTIPSIIHCIITLLHSIKSGIPNSHTSNLCYPSLKVELVRVQNTLWWRLSLYTITTVCSMYIYSVHYSIVLLFPYHTWWLHDNQH